ncbi:DUF1344 domain-containing protein [Mesorhizobium sp. PUT5]|uniref:DUF1344 domain-containing protein n=1 Tax=Mesorhizobium sp. PUT5 TaxID=3454629 RepID=UPI003FA47411
MKKAVIIAALALATAASTVVFAKEMTGTIKAINKNNDSIMLTDGKTLKLPEGIEAETLKAGEKVTIVYSSKAGKLMVSDIHAAKCQRRSKIRPSGGAKVGHLAP